MIKVRPRGNESVQQMLKRFKRLCQREGLIRDMKRHSYYEKPSERKRRQSRKTVRKVDGEGEPRADTRQRAVFVGARAQVRDAAQELVAVPLLL